MSTPFVRALGKRALGSDMPMKVANGSRASLKIQFLELAAAAFWVRRAAPSWRLTMPLPAVTVGDPLYESLTEYDHQHACGHKRSRRRYSPR